MIKLATPFHTFAISAYGDSPYLPACIRSCKSQTRQTQVILCTSTPSLYLEKLAEEFQIPYLVRTGESGICEDWNFAAACAKSEFVTIAHQDDLYEKHYVEELFRAAEAYPDLTLFTTDYVPIRNGKPSKREKLELVKILLRIPLRIPALNHLPVVKRAALIFGNSICCPACSYSKLMLPEPLFDSGYHFALDWEELLKLADGFGRFVCVEKPLMFHRLHEDAATNACMEDETRRREEASMFARFWPDFMVRFLMRFYTKAYDSYEIKEKNGE